MNTRDKDPMRVKKLPAEQGRSPWPKHGRSRAKRNAARLAVTVVVLTACTAVLARPAEVKRHPHPTPHATAVPTPPATASPVPTGIPTLTPAPTATASAPAGLPVIPAGYGTVLRKVFTDGSLAPFAWQTWAGGFMTTYTRYGDPSHASVHDGYLDLRATRRPDGVWDGAFVATSRDGNGPTFGYGVYRLWLSFNIGPGTWQAGWLYDTSTWTADEIDFPEMLESLQLTYHVIGTGPGSKYGVPIPADLATRYHEFRIERRATFTAFAIDGIEVGRVTAPQSAKKMAILFDAKMGFGWMGGSGQISAFTPNPTFLHVAGLTVDP